MFYGIALQMLLCVFWGWWSRSLEWDSEQCARTLFGLLVGTLAIGLLALLGFGLAVTWIAALLDRRRT